MAEDHFLRTRVLACFRKTGRVELAGHDLSAGLIPKPAIIELVTSTKHNYFGSLGLGE